MKSIYLDYAATTPVDPNVVEKMLPYFTDLFGNPSSTHAFGRDSLRGLRESRQIIAECLHCSPKEIVFTSGGTESDNFAVFGAARNKQGKGHIITTAVEHQAVLAACRQLEKEGYSVTYVPVSNNGQADPDDIKQAITPNTVLISVMYGNNEVGTIQPIAEIGEIAKEHGILFHVDAVQALGSVSIDLNSFPADLVSFSAHKIYGPKGAGILYVSEQASLTPFHHGGKQERTLRGGTENVPGIVGMAEAVRAASENWIKHQEHYRLLKKAFIQSLHERLDGNIVLNGDEESSLPHICNISFPGIKAETLIMGLDLEGIAVSSGSACTSGSIQPSHVLQAMGQTSEIVQSAVRFSFGKQTTIDDILTTSKKIETIIERIRRK